jgi:hypothetical protein
MVAAAYNAPWRIYMPNDSGVALSIGALFAEREARRQRDLAAEQHLKQEAKEQAEEYRKRLADFRMTEEQQKTLLDRIKRSFDKGEAELMLVSFPSGFCTDGGRAINNIGEPPINRPDPRAVDPAEAPPAWLATLPVGASSVYEYWRSALKPGGFSFDARIINYPGGMPGDIGLFITWPKDPPDAVTDPVR